jgi:siderophore synthetase component
VNELTNNGKPTMKTELSIHTPNAGIVRVLPDYSQVNGCVMLEYLFEVTAAERTAAARYLFEEGFIEFANGTLELDSLAMDRKK